MKIMFDYTTLLVLVLVQFAYKRSNRKSKYCSLKLYKSLQNCSKIFQNFSKLLH